MNLSIRAARPEDAFRLVPLIHAFASDVAESATTGPGGVARHALGPDRVVTTLLAETDGRVVGFAMFHPSYLSFSGTRGLFLTDLFVEASHRRRGVARALMAAVAEQCRAEGGQWIEWEVWRKTPPALAFYEQIGARDRTGLLSMILEGEAFARLAATPRDG
jgi:GNAT superfamily N-acetyltransferase